MVFLLKEGVLNGDKNSALSSGLLSSLVDDAAFFDIEDNVALGQVDDEELEELNKNALILLSLVTPHKVAGADKVVKDELPVGRVGVDKAVHFNMLCNNIIVRSA